MSPATIPVQGSCQKVQIVANAPIQATKQLVQLVGLMKANVLMESRFTVSSTELSSILTMLLECHNALNPIACPLTTFSMSIPVLFDVLFRNQSA